MSIGMSHRLALAATLALPALGLVSGSTLLLAACVAYFLTLLVGFFELHARTRSRSRTFLVHGLTMTGLVFAIAVFPRAQIDSGLIVVMLGVFNRYLLRAGQRDDLILVGAAGVLLAAATIVTPGVAFALIILGFVPVALWTMLSASILGLSERHQEETYRTASFRRLAKRPSPRLAGAITGWGIALMLAGYLAVSFLPRYRFGHLLSAGGLRSFSGAGSHMALTNGGVTGGSDGRVALRVRVPKGAGQGLVQGLYARTYVLDGFEGAGFSDTKGRLAAYPGGRPRRANEDCLLVDLRRQAPRREPHPIAVLGREGPTTVTLRRPERHQSGTWVTRIAQASLDIRYGACISQRAQADVPEAPEAQAAYLARFVQVPDNLDPRIPALAKSLVGEATDPKERVRRVLAHFNSGFSYSLSPMEGSSEEPLSRFLFEARAGHCELYAGAVVALLRSIGVPARVAVGYYGGWFNRRSRHLELGSDDAHAWVEVLHGNQWHWVDATPPDLRARRTHKSLAWIWDVWDALESLWYDYVIDFDEERRQAMMADLTDRLSGGGDIFSGLLQGELTLRSGGRWGGGVGVLLGGLIGAAGMAMLLFFRAGRQLNQQGVRLRRLMGGEAKPGAPLGVLVRDQPASLRALAQVAVQRYESVRFGPPGNRGSVAGVVSAVNALAVAKKSADR